MNTDCTREVLRAVGTDEKEQMARSMHKLKAAVHGVVSPAGLLEAKNAPMERKKNEASGHRSDCIEQKEDNGSFSFRQRVQKVICLMQILILHFLYGLIQMIFQNKKLFVQTLTIHNVYF